jgi:hypothetical protein
MTNFDSAHDYELSPDGRPDFLVKLGVLLPCTPEDVKQAYLAKVRTAHPDTGGSQEAFLDLQEAFDRATEYANFISGRRKWLGAQIERYAQQEELVLQIVNTGGHVRYEHKDWLSREIGADFAQVLDVVVEVYWTGPGVGDEQIEWLVRHRDIFSSLRSLNLAQSQVSDEGVERLGCFTALERLGLRGTPITHRALGVLESLPSLVELDIRETRIGAMRLYFGRRSHPGLEIIR